MSDLIPIINEIHGTIENYFGMYELNTLQRALTIYANDTG